MKKRNEHQICQIITVIKLKLLIVIKFSVDSPQIKLPEVSQQSKSKPKEKKKENSK